jgi:transposase
VAQNFLPCDRDQELLLPPSLREWLPDDHLAWYVLDSVAELELDAFYPAYRSDGWGAAAHDPQMMVALLLYACVRSARGIERRCSEDVAFRVIAANQIPDHATIARFRARHERAISDPFSGVLSLCARAGPGGSDVTAPTQATLTVTGVCRMTWRGRPSGSGWDGPLRMAGQATPHAAT